MKSERACVHFRGHVQGVGFRFTCRSLARGYCVTGVVKNLPDGSVQLLAEGERPEVEAFIKAIGESHLKPFVKEVALEWLAATAEWTNFHIEH